LSYFETKLTFTVTYRVGNISCSLSKLVPFQNHSMLFNKILFLVPVHCNNSISLNQIFHFVPLQQLDISFWTTRHAAHTSVFGILSRILVKLIFNSAKVMFSVQPSLAKVYVQTWIIQWVKIRWWCRLVAWWKKSGAFGFVRWLKNFESKSC
jgi:hypothetical protein